MTHSTQNPPVQLRPIHAFINEMIKFQYNPAHPVSERLLPDLNSAFEALFKLMHTTEQFPDLSGSRWFLQHQFETTMNEALDQLHIARDRLVRLADQANELGDPPGFRAFTDEFLKFFESVIQSPVMFQQPYELQFTLNVPAPTPMFLEEEPLQSLLTDDLLGLR